MNAETHRLNTRPEASEQRRIDAEELMAALAVLTKYRDGVLVELALLKDSTGLDKPRFLAAISGHRGHVELHRCEGEAHPYEIDGQPYCCISTTLN